MASAEFYQREAERCRALAAATDDHDAAQRWLCMARDYDTLADALTNDGKASASIPMGTPVQRQEIQQQQSKSEPEGKKSEPKDKP